MNRNLRSLQAAAWISPLDRHFAEGMGRIGGDARPEVLLAAALASRHVGAGHVCLDLAGVAEDLESAGVRIDLVLPPHEEWLELLRHSPLVCVIADETSASRQPAPLVLDSAGRLYLHRYWRLQENVANDLRSRAADRINSVDIPLLQAGLDRYFKTLDPAQHREEGGGEGADRGNSTLAAREPDRQRIAAALSVMQRLSVISGGPGTGKTSTVARILALIVEQALKAGEGAPTLTLVAPTGKAAATLADSIRRVALELDCDARIKDAIPAEAATIHRCLGLGAYRSRTPRHHADNPLATDLVLVDEASMVDLVLMHRLLAAVPAHARLILLGDEHQLASVEAGAILGDICSSEASSGYSTGFAARLAEATGEAIEAGEERAGLQNGQDGPALRDCITRLTRSHRYAEGSGIAALSEAIREGNAEAALEVLDDADFPDVSRMDPGRAGSLSRELRQDIVAGYSEFLRESEPDGQLKALSAFRILTPHRRGPFGVEAMNRLVEALLQGEGLDSAETTDHARRPIMVTRNDYELGLFNGDIGVLTSSSEGRPQAYFAAVEGDLRSVSPSRLPQHEPVYAMTIYKSQGSEFDRVAVVLPEHASDTLSRELLYTAITRARTAVRIHATHDSVLNAIQHRIDRSSGLGAILRG